MEKVTACLITWKRQQNLPAIIGSLTQYPFIDEIIIRDNSKGKNIINYGRYTSAKKAKNNLIYVQDDDFIVENIDELYQAYLAHPETIVNGGIPEYLAVVPDNIYGTAQMAIVGWGTLFNRQWVEPALSPYLAKYGKDYCFYRETDRIFTMLYNRHHTMVATKVTPLFGTTNEDALSSQADHVQYKFLAINRCKELLCL